MSTEPLFVPALASLDDLVPHEGILSPAELEGVAREIAGGRSMWEPLVHSDPEHRRYELVYEDDRMDAWILSWMPGQGTGFHDHYISGVGLCVASGCVREDLMVYGGEHQSRQPAGGRHPPGRPRLHPPRQPRRRRAGRDGARLLAATRLGRPVPPRATTGVVLREVRPGRNELTEQLIADGALQHVLERF